LSETRSPARAGSDAVGPRPFAALGFVANLTVLGVAGGRALLGRARLSAVERATVALALPIGVLVLGTVAAAALGLHLDRRLWAALVAVAAEAAAVGVLSRRGHPGGPRNPPSWPPSWPRRWRPVRPQGGRGILWAASLTAAGAVLAGAVALSVWTAGHQAYPAFSALSAVRVGGAERSVRIELTSEEAAPARFIVAVAVGGARPDSITLLLAPGVTWRKTVPAATSASVTVVAYRGTRPRVPYREVHLAPRGSG
jgi:lysylphosphatidylglycerol synthetase-like protein (DUF2156 family)